MNDNPFITLDEGIRSGEVQVFELDGVQPMDHEVQAAEEPSISEEDPFEEQPATDDESVGDEQPFADGDEDREHPDSDESPPRQDVDNDELYAEVERVLVRNDSEKPLYLMPGEIILGGQQDRCVAQETIIPAGSEAQTVEVFCVEPGRWSGRTAEELAFFAESFGASLAADDAETSSEAADDSYDKKFVATAGVLHKRGRLAVQASKDQSAVWDEVQAAKLASGNNVDTDSFTGNYADGEVIAMLAPYCTELEETVSSQENIIGVVVAINGRIESADIFGSTPLFRRMWPKLLQSYAFDAAIDQPGDIAETSSLAIADAEQFLQEIETARTTKTDTSSGLVLSSRTEDDAEGRPFVTSIVPADGAAGGMGGMGGGFGGAVHMSGFAQ